MNQKLMVFSIALVIFSGINAQLHEVTFGLKAGINVSNIKETGYASVSYNSLVGGTGGAFASIPINKSFSIQPEVSYSQMGAKSKLPDPQFNPLYPNYGTGALEGLVYYGKMNLSYLNVPVLLRYSVKKTGFSLFAGPQIGFLLSAKLKDAGTNQNYKSEIKSTDWSGIVGIGYDLPLGFNVSARYQTGFTNITKDQSWGLDDKNNAFTLSLGYVFGRKK